MGGLIKKSQESCVINAGTTVTYVRLQKGALQGNLVSAYLFTLALNILFYLLEANSKIGLNIRDYSFLYSAYIDDAALILKNVSYVTEIVTMIDYFSNYLGLNSKTFPNVKSVVCGSLSFKICWLDIR